MLKDSATTVALGSASYHEFIGHRLPGNGFSSERVAVALGAHSWNCARLFHSCNLRASCGLANVAPWFSVLTLSLSSRRRANCSSMRTSRSRVVSSDFRQCSVAAPFASFCVFLVCSKVGGVVAHVPVTTRLPAAQTSAERFVRYGQRQEVEGMQKLNKQVMQSALYQNCEGPLVSRSSMAWFDNASAV